MADLISIRYSDSTLKLISYTPGLLQGLSVLECFIEQPSLFCIEASSLTSEYLILTERWQLSLMLRLARNPERDTLCTPHKARLPTKWCPQEKKAEPGKGLKALIILRIVIFEIIIDSTQHIDHYQNANDLHGVEQCF